MSKFSRFSRLNAKPIRPGIGSSDLVAQTFQADNAARLREGAELFTKKMLPKNGTIGQSITGGLTPAGLDLKLHRKFLDHR